MWYGKGKRLFQDLDTNYIEIFNEMRAGKIPKISDEGRIPDLREMLITYGKTRIKEEFTEDQIIIKLAAFRESLDESINTYYEKIKAFALLYDLRGDAEPCTFFRSFSGSDLIHDVFSEGASLCEFRDRLEIEIEERVHKLLLNLLQSPVSYLFVQQEQTRIDLHEGPTYDIRNGTIIKVSEPESLAPLRHLTKSTNCTRPHLTCELPRPRGADGTCVLLNLTELKNHAVQLLTKPASLKGHP